MNAKPLPSSPNLDGGFIGIANELFDAILKFPFTLKQMNVLLTVLRKTYGFGKKVDDMSAKQIGDMCGMARNHVTTTLNDLHRMNVITKFNGAYGCVVGINKCHQEWRSLDDKNSSPPLKVVPIRDSTESVLRLVPNREKSSPESGETLVPDRDTQKTTNQKTNQKTTSIKAGRADAQRFKGRFDEFWEAFGHKHGKAQATASWIAICSAAEKAGEDLNALADRIIDAAKIEAKRRVSVVAHNGTPMYPQRWLSQRRFEDEGLLAWGRFEPAEQAFIDCFNENIGDISPLVEDWTEERSVLVKAAVAGRWDLETWGRFWSHVRDTCRFDWPVSIEWLLDRKNFEKVRDGQYSKDRREA